MRFCSAKGPPPPPQTKKKKTPYFFFFFLATKKKKKNKKKFFFFFFTFLEENAYSVARNIATALRREGYIVELDISNRSFKAQLKYADKIQANYVCIIGEEELKNNQCILKNMKDGSQILLALNEQAIQKEMEMIHNGYKK